MGLIHLYLFGVVRLHSVRDYVGDRRVFQHSVGEAVYHQCGVAAYCGRTVAVAICLLSASVFISMMRLKSLLISIFISVFVFAYLAH